MTIASRLQALNQQRVKGGSGRPRMTSGSGQHLSQRPLTLGLLVDTRVLDTSSRCTIELVAHERRVLLLCTAERLEVGARLEQHTDTVRQRKTHPGETEIEREEEVRRDGGRMGRIMREIARKTERGEKKKEREVVMGENEKEGR